VNTSGPADSWRFCSTDTASDRAHVESATRHRRSASRLARGCTTASARSAGRTSADAVPLRRRACPAQWRAERTCSCPERCADLVMGQGSPVRRPRCQSFKRPGERGASSRSPLVRAFANISLLGQRLCTRALPIISRSLRRRVGDVRGGRSAGAGQDHQIAALDGHRY